MKPHVLFSALLSCWALNSVAQQGVNNSADSTKRSITSSQAMRTDTANAAQMTNARTFGGARQFNTFSIGINAGAVSPALATGGSLNDFSNKNVKIGYGADLRLQLTHVFGLELDAHGGKIAGSNMSSPGGIRYYPSTSNVAIYNYSTQFWSGTLSAVANVLDLDFLHRQKGINIFVSAGGGMAWYHPILQTNAAYAPSFQYFDAPGARYTVRSLLIPVGAGAKFRLTDAVQLILGYTENFTDDDNLDGIKANYPTRDHYSYGYGGFEFTLGPKSKRNLDWVNPVAMMYDELYDAALRQEVEALKGRVTNVENAVNDLKKDSDGDGVSDQFDKCPATPAGTVVDGAGCELKFPQVVDTTTHAAAVTSVAAPETQFVTIHFARNSSRLHHAAHNALKAMAADLRANNGKIIEIDGYASSEGAVTVNKKLSKKRARAVKAYLVKLGIKSHMLKVKAMGVSQPVGDNSTEAGRMQNRRVEFKQD